MLPLRQRDRPLRRCVARSSRPACCSFTAKGLIAPVARGPQVHFPRRIHPREGFPLRVALRCANARYFSTLRIPFPSGTHEQGLGGAGSRVPRYIRPGYPVGSLPRRQCAPRSGGSRGKGSGLTGHGRDRRRARSSAARTPIENVLPAFQSSKGRHERGALPAKERKGESLRWVEEGGIPAGAGV